MSGTPRSPDENARGGFALLSVLMVLLALLVLCAPFLMTARNATKASAQLADRAQARLALDSAARNARAALGDSHPALDTTPYYDDADELAVRSEFKAGFVDTHDPRGVMWDATVSDVAGWIDLNSAPPQVFANALGATTRLVDAVKSSDKELNVATTWGFPPLGFLWVEGELIGYTELDGQRFKGLQRGLGGRVDEEGNSLPCGPQPASDHAIGTIVIDQRAWAPALWRATTPDGALRTFDAPEQLRDTVQLALGIDPKKTDDVRAFVAPISALVSTYGGVRAGREWQKPVRLKNALRGGLDCLLDVDERRWFNPGATVMISDGETTELGIVASIADRGLRLMDPVRNDYNAFRAEVRVLARRPVNVNLAPRAVLEVLFTNLADVRGKHERITRTEAEALAQLVIDSRPFTGFEDFVRRIVMPAAALERLPSDAPVVPAVLAQGGAIIDAYDAIALYANALNANDVSLSYSTMPFSFTTRDVFDLDLRASVNAPSGVERIAAARGAVEMITPQRNLMQLWARQEDWDSAMRLDCEAPWWSTGPNATSMWDSGAAPPSRLWAHLGTYAGRTFVAGITQLPAATAPATPPVATHVFASREDTGWAQLWASRVDEMGLRAGRVLHFDFETRDNEGRYLPDETVVQAPADKLVQWTTAADPLLRALDFSLWIKPRSLADGTIFDVGRTSLETDRITLSFESPDLVLRVFDAGGDITTTTLREAGEARFSIAQGQNQGLLADTWSHVAVDVRGTRPSQISMFVDGRTGPRFGVRMPGLTRLAAALPPSSTTITVESDEGFPDQGVLRIGHELIEYVKQGTNHFEATVATTGPNAGFGGRIARIAYQGGDYDYGVGTATGVVDNHTTGTPVELYGYSALLESDVPSGSATLTSYIGKFAVGVLDRVVGGQQTLGDPIVISQVGFMLGFGLGGNTSQVTGLMLRPADDPSKISTQQVLDAFSSTGGYAALIQRIPDNFVNSQQGQTITQLTTPDNAPIFGTEIVSYTGHDGTTLTGIARMAIPVGTTQSVRHAFVSDFADGVTANQIDADLQLEWEVFVVPISFPAPGATSLTGFLTPNNGSEFAQITNTDQVELTEWIRYDRIDNFGFTRTDANALLALGLALTHGPTVIQGGGGGLQPPPPQPPLPPPGGGGGPAAPSNNVAAAVQPASVAAASTALAASAQQSTTQPYLWRPYFGQRDDDDLFVTRAARTAFQFRGVFGTYSHDHNAAGTVLLPVWRLQHGASASALGEADRGEPGRSDEVILMEDSSGSLGWPARIHRAYHPLDYSLFLWTTGSDLLTAAAVVPPVVVIEDAALLARNAVWLALDSAARVPIPATPVVAGSAPNYETRTQARVLKHPSGERPREPDRVIVGGTIRSAAVPSATVDEIVFGSTLFGGTGATQGGHLVLTQVFNEGALVLKVGRGELRIAYGRYATNSSYLPSLTQDAGLLRIGDEIVCYSAIDDATGTLTIAPGGRGLLGTTDGTHEIGETAAFLDPWTVGVLSAATTADSNTLSLTDIADFPFQGTVIIGDELIHYTRTTGSVLEMPRHSGEPGRQDNQGAGLFRGRFGTTAQAHVAGTPVILFPFRYWDRWADRADGPELAYFSLCVDQPQGFFRSAFWIDEEPSSGQARIEVLQRATTRGAPPVPWDGDPDTTPGLAKFTQGTKAGQPNLVAESADLIEWRAHVIYDINAFDAVTGLSHGWKQTPHLKVFGTEYLGPNLVLRRVDQ